MTPETRNALADLGERLGAQIDAETRAALAEAKALHLQSTTEGADDALGTLARASLASGKAAGLNEAVRILNEELGSFVADLRSEENRL